MPHERRLIRFSSPEVEEALRNFAEQHDRTLPDSKVVGIEYEDETEEGVGARMKFEKAPRPTRFTALETAAALIAYCRKVRVPIPKQGQKSLHKHKEHLVMQIDVRPR